MLHCLTLSRHQKTFNQIQIQSLQLEKNRQICGKQFSTNGRLRQDWRQDYKMLKHSNGKKGVDWSTQ